MNIYLIGYRGTGKTTVGRMLADLLSWKWIDSDHEIQDRSGSTIAEIFARDGEEGFRDLETEVVRTISHLQNHVVSLGGGAILREENRDLIKRADQIELERMAIHPILTIGSSLLFEAFLVALAMRRFSKMDF